MWCIAFLGVMRKEERQSVREYIGKGYPTKDEAVAAMNEAKTKVDPRRKLDVYDASKVIDLW